MKVHLTLKLFPKIKALLTVGTEKAQRIFTKSYNYLRSLVQSIHLKRWALDQRLQPFWATQSWNQALDPSSADTTESMMPTHLVPHPGSKYYSSFPNHGASNEDCWTAPITPWGLAACPAGSQQYNPTVCHLRVQTFLKLCSASLGQFWHLPKGLQTSFSAVQVLGKGPRPPTALCWP